MAGEGHEPRAAAGAKVGEIEETAHNAASDVPRYVVADGRLIPDHETEADAENGRVRAPRPEEPSPAPKLPPEGSITNQERALRGVRLSDPRSGLPGRGGPPGSALSVQSSVE
jgi:hypothetical protein